MIAYFENGSVNLTKKNLRLRTILELSFNITGRSNTLEGVVTIQHAKKGTVS
jgi:hypothetical protein